MNKENNNYIFEFEKNKLHSTIDSLENFKNTINESLINLYKYEKDSYNLQLYGDLYSRILSNLKKNIDSPYFAKIEYQDDNEKKLETLYIGKVGFTSMDGENEYVIDWRAPISQVYYNGKLGRVSYSALDHEYHGILSLKRQLDIKNRELLNVYDNNDLISNDDFLKPYLTTSADNRLKSIVSTIQKEQDAIIRQPIYKNLVIQGVAGCGKTTVALHRLSYLVYTYEKTIKTNEYLILAPNKIFLNYISEILPDLDVGNTQENTIEEFVKEFAEIKYNFLKKHELFNNLIQENKDTSYLKYKTSLKYLTDIENFIESYIENKILKEIRINNILLLSHQEVLDMYEEINHELSIDLQLNILAKKIATLFQSSKYTQKIINYFNTNISYDISEKHKLIKLIENDCSNYIKKLFQKNKFNIVQIYKYFLNNISTFCDIRFSPDIKKNTLSLIKNKTIGYDDLGAILYLSYRFFDKKQDNIKQVLIDEAQDLSETLYFSLVKVFNNAHFSIFGDLTQGIYEFQAIDNWNSVIIDCFKNNAELIELKKSYRTTIEIMAEANKISGLLNFPKGENVLRHGNPVQHRKLSIIQNDLLDAISELENKNCTSIAIICKDNRELQYCKSLLKHDNIRACDENDTNYYSGKCILDVQTSKGLEFDGVIIFNENSYDKTKSIDIKSLYVAMTRALHELIIFTC